VNPVVWHRFREQLARLVLATSLTSHFEFVEAVSALSAQGTYLISLSRAILFALVRGGPGVVVGIVHPG
jgi:hypothetical protein